MPNKSCLILLRILVAFVLLTSAISGVASEWVLQSDESSELCEAVYERIKLIADPENGDSQCSIAAAISYERLTLPEWQKADILANKLLVYELFIYLHLRASTYDKEFKSRSVKYLSLTGEYAPVIKRADDFIKMGGELYFLRKRVVEHMDASSKKLAPDPQTLAQLRYPESYSVPRFDNCPEMKKVKIPATLTFFINSDFTGPEPSARFIASRVFGAVMRLDAGRAVFFDSTIGDISISVDGEIGLGQICTIVSNQK